MTHPFLRGALALLLCAAALFVEASEPVGRVLLARGDVTATAADGSIRALVRRDEVREADVLETGADGVLQVRFDDGATLELRPGSRLEVTVYRYNRSAAGPDSVLLEIFEGALRAVSGVIGGEQYEVRTPVASIGIRGTHYETSAEDDDAWVFGVWNGGIRVYNEHGTIDLGADADFLFARARPGEAPVGLVRSPSALASDPAGMDGFGRARFAGGDAQAPVASLDEDTRRFGADAARAVELQGGVDGAVDGAARINPAENVGSEEELATLRDLIFEGDPVLTEREREALASGRERGILVLQDGRIVTGPAATGDDGGPLFLVPLGDGAQALIRGGAALIEDPSQNVGGFDVSWGRFAAGGPQVFLDDGSEVREGALVGDLDFLLVETARLTDLTVRAAYGGDLAFGTTSAGEITDFGVFFDADLDLGSGRISDGHLLLEAGGGVEEYRVNFEGLVREGEALLGVTQGTITGTGIDGTLEVDRDLSVLRGLFTSGGEGFAGGFGLQEAGNPDRFARGGFVAEQLSGEGETEAP